MIEPKELAEAYARNVRVIQAQTEGLNHADSLLQLPFRGNCLNWVIGHIISSRDEVLAALGEPPVLDGAATECYRRTSDPVTQDGAQVLPLEDLLGKLGQSQERIAAVLEPATDADMDRELKLGERTTTVGKYVFFRYFHESYHVGQTELLRQLAGVNDQVI